MNDTDRVGESRPTQKTTPVALWIALAEHSILLLTGLQGLTSQAFFVYGGLVFLVFPCASIFLAGLLFLWLRYTLKDDRHALLWTSVAAAAWPPIQVLSLFLLAGTGSIDAAWYVGLAVPYVVPAAVVLFRWP